MPLMLTDATIRQHLEGKITVDLYAINRHLLPAFSGLGAFFRLLPTRYSNMGVG